MSNAQDSRFRQGLWPYAMILAAAFILASNHIIGRWVQGDMPPMGIGFWRLFIATAVLMPFAGRSVWAKRGLLRQHWKLFVVMAVALGPFGNAAVYVAYHFTTAINGGVVSTAQPVATVLITFFLFRESITRVQTLGIILATVGVFVILSRGDLGVLAALKPNIGDLIMLAAMFGFAVHNSLLRKIPGDFTTLEILLSVQCVSMVVMLALCHRNHHIQADARNLGGRRGHGLGRRRGGDHRSRLHQHSGAVHRGQQGHNVQLYPCLTDSAACGSYPRRTP